MSIANVYDFKEQLIISTGTSANKTIGSLLLSVFPGTSRVMHSLEVHDRQGVDWWLEMKSGERLGVDCKILTYDPKEKYGDNIPLETWSVIGKKIGWTLDESKITDYIFWFWKDTGRWCYIPFQPLLRSFKKNKDLWVKEYKVCRQNTEGRYKSECVMVNRTVVWRSIYHDSEGNSDALVEKNVLQNSLIQS